MVSALMTGDPTTQTLRGAGTAACPSRLPGTRRFGWTIRTFARRRGLAATAADVLGLDASLTRPGTFVAASCRRLTGDDPRPFGLSPVLNLALSEVSTKMEADRTLSLSWIEALVAANEDVIACERRFHRQCILVGSLAEHGQVAAEDEMLLASYITSLGLVRAHRDDLLADAVTAA